MRRSFVFLMSLFVAGALFAAGSSGGSSSSGGGGGTTRVASSTPSAIDWYNRGFAASDVGKYQDAINDFQQAISLRADYAEAYLQEGNLAKAVQQYIILQKAGTKNAGELLEKINDFVTMKS